MIYDHFIGFLGLVLTNLRRRVFYEGRSMNAPLVFCAINSYSVIRHALLRFHEGEACFRLVSDNFGYKIKCAVVLVFLLE